MALITRRKVCLLFLVVLPMDTALAKVAVSGGPGRAMDSAIVISADTSSEGLAAEYSVLRERFPGWGLNGQSLRGEGSRYFDVFTLSKNGDTIEVWFDITSFFGR
jgi:hypothetical protein